MFFHIPDTNPSVTYTAEGGVKAYGIFGGLAIGIDDVTIPDSSTSVYVSNDGDDLNNGLTIAHPKKTLQAAVTVIQNTTDAPNRTSLVCLDGSVFSESLTLPSNAVTLVYMPLATIRGALVTNAMQRIVLGALLPRDSNAVLLLQEFGDYDYTSISIQNIMVNVSVRAEAKGTVVFNFPSGNITWGLIEVPDDLEAIGIIRDEARFRVVERIRQSVTFGRGQNTVSQFAVGARTDFRIKEYLCYLHTVTTINDGYIDAGRITIRLDGGRANPVVKHFGFDSADAYFTASIQNDIVYIRYVRVIPPDGARARFIQVASV